MTLPEYLMIDFNLIVSSTRRTLERIPDAQEGFRLHDRSGPLGRIAMHCATMPLLGVIIIEDDELDQADRQTRPRPATDFLSREDCLCQLAENVSKLRETIRTTTDSHLNALWPFRAGDHMILKESRAFTIRFLVLNHMIHHTAQLGQYLRAIGVEVPALYGPSADEQFSFRS